MNHNWSATKQHLHPQSVAEIICHSVLSGDRIRQRETSSGSRHKDTVSVSRHFLLQAPQCPCSCCRGRSKPGCWIVGSHTRWELTTWASIDFWCHLVISPATAVSWTLLKLADMHDRAVPQSQVEWSFWPLNHMAHVASCTLCLCQPQLMTVVVTVADWAVLRHRWLLVVMDDEILADNWQGDHLYGKSANAAVREVSRKSRLKLFIVSCIFASIFDFAELLHFILVSDHALLH